MPKSLSLLMFLFWSGLTVYVSDTYEDKYLTLSCICMMLMFGCDYLFKKQ